MKKISRLLPILLAITILFTACGDKKKIDAKSNADSKKVEVKNNKDKKKDKKEDKKEDKEKTTTEKESTSKTQKKKTKPVKANTKKTNSKPKAPKKVNSSNQKAEVNKTITMFFNSAKSSQQESMDKYCKNLDTSDLDANNSIDDLNDLDEFEKLLIREMPKITYTITQTTVNGNKATVNVKCKYVDLALFMDRTIDAAVDEIAKREANGETITDEQSDAIFDQVLSQRIASFSPNYIVNPISIPLEKVDGKWLISDVSDNLLDVLLCNIYTY